MEIRKEQTCILVKAYAQASTKYQEPVCCAGITPSGQLRRLYPIVYRQLQSLFDEHPIKPLPSPEYVFRLEFASDDKRHAMTLHDWEVQATYAGYKRRYGGPDAALEKMDTYYGERLPV